MVPLLVLTGALLGPRCIRFIENSRTTLWVQPLLGWTALDGPVPWPPNTDRHRFTVGRSAILRSSAWQSLKVPCISMLQQLVSAAGPFLSVLPLEEIISSRESVKVMCRCNRLPVATVMWNYLLRCLFL